MSCLTHSAASLGDPNRSYAKPSAVLYEPLVLRIGLYPLFYTWAGAGLQVGPIGLLPLMKSPT